MYRKEKIIERLAHLGRNAEVIKTPRVFGAGNLFILRFFDGEHVATSQAGAHALYAIYGRQR